MREIEAVCRLLRHPDIRLLTLAGPPGIRQDPYANAHRIPVEEEKQGNERGKYLHPGEWGQPESLSLGLQDEQKAGEARTNDK